MNIRLKYIKPLFMSVCVAVILTSCEYAYIEPIVVELPPDPVSYAEKIQPAFTNNCMPCHASVSPVLTTGVSYNNLMTGGHIDLEFPAQSEVYINSLGHKATSFSAEESAYLLLWIEQGAINN